MPFSLSRQLAAEFIGTLILVGVVVGSGILADRFTADTAIALWGNTAATGAILVVLILIFGPVSGAHFNPAVTLVMMIRRDTTVSDGERFIIAQFPGRLCGTLLAHGMFDETLIQLSLTARDGPSKWLSEGVATFTLIAAILGTLRFRPDAVPYAVGLVITAGYWWTASTSFANPAVTLARAFTDTFAGIRPEDVAPFMLAQVAGAVLALGIMRWMLDSDLKKPSSP